MGKESIECMNDQMALLPTVNVNQPQTNNVILVFSVTPQKIFFAKREK